MYEYKFYNGDSIRDKVLVKKVKLASSIEAVAYAENNIKELLGDEKSLYLYDKNLIYHCDNNNEETYVTGNRDILAAAQAFADVVQNSYILPTCPFGSRLRSINLYELGEDTLFAHVVALVGSRKIEKTIDFARLMSDSTTIDKAYSNLLESIMSAVPWDIRSITLPRVSFEVVDSGAIARVGSSVRFIRYIRDEGWQIRI